MWPVWEWPPTLAEPWQVSGPWCNGTIGGLGSIDMPEVLSYISRYHQNKKNIHLTSAKDPSGEMATSTYCQPALNIVSISASPTARPNRDDIERSDRERWRHRPIDTSRRAASSIHRARGLFVQLGRSIHRSPRPPPLDTATGHLMSATKREGVAPAAAAVGRRGSWRHESGVLLTF